MNRKGFRLQKYIKIDKSYLYTFKTLIINTQKPGDSFSNWIGLTKEKLRERESALMKIRMGCIKDAIFNAIILFNNNPGNTKHGIKINEQCCKEIEPMINNKDIINSCMNALNGILNQWNGIDLTRSNKEFDTYRQYFVVSKNWFDQRKKDILSKFLWAKILYLIREFSDKAANQFFNTLNNPQLNMMENQSNYRRSLVLSVCLYFCLFLCRFVFLFFVFICIILNIYSISTIFCNKHETYKY